MDAMNRFVRARARLAVIAGAWALVLFCGTTSAAAASCAQRVIGDWSNDGRVDAVYELHCYEEAIDTIPRDLRDYTNALDVIERALTVALRSQAAQDTTDVPTSEATSEVGTSGAASRPFALLAGGGLVVALLAAGAAGRVARRRRASAD
jgi:hypothetical protein